MMLPEKYQPRLWHVLALFLLCWLIVLPFYRYQVNPDGISYINIAKKYVNTDLSVAVNGSWAPLVSWLMIPFIAAGVDPMLAFRIVCMLAGMACLAGMGLLCAPYFSSRCRDVVLLSFIPMVTWWSVSLQTPDLLAAAGMIVFLHLLVNRPGSRDTLIFMIPVVGALCFYARQYHFYICPLLLVGFYAVQRKAFHVKGIRPQHIVLCLLVFVLCCAPWIYLISRKYGHLTVSAAQTFNVNTIAPPGHRAPLFNEIILPPSDPHAVSAWDDLAFHPMKDWYPFASVFDMWWECQLVLKAVYDYTAFMWAYLLFCAAAVFVAYGQTEEHRRHLVRSVLVFVILYPAGYLVNHVESRFLWASQLLLLLATIVLLKGRATRMLLIPSLAFMLIYPSWKLFQNRNSGQMHHELAKMAVERAGDLKESRIACEPGMWSRGLYLCYYTGAKFYGVSNVSESFAELHKNNIDLYLTDHPETFPGSKMADLKGVYLVRLNRDSSTTGNPR